MSVKTSHMTATSPLQLVKIPQDPSLVPARMVTLEMAKHAQVGQAHTSYILLMLQVGQYCIWIRSLLIVSGASVEDPSNHFNFI
jgi:hypothetical protein